MLYSRGKAPTPPAESMEPEAEVEELGEELEYEETPDGKGLKPRGVDLIAGNDRLMKFLEDDIDAMQAEVEEEERRVEKNWKNLNERGA